MWIELIKTVLNADHPDKTYHDDPVQFNPGRVHWDKDQYENPIEAKETPDGRWFVLKRKDNGLPISIYDDHERAKQIASDNGMNLVAVEPLSDLKWEMCHRCQGLIDTTTAWQTASYTPAHHVSGECYNFRFCNQCERDLREWVKSYKKSELK